MNVIRLEAALAFRLGKITRHLAQDLACRATIKVRVRIASREMLPGWDLLPHLTCSPPASIGGGRWGQISMTTRDELVVALAGR
jgi:hypothetical protein